ncbi:O-antigen ligase family protein [Cetobacterium sp.]|uniref:O-antigen ligase family protein n=1 Tax=Cetobacterium sp. TaxID=2071632 RepID=UPI0025B7F0A6|nr:O-antigen ligase family protein [Cetobacterium sp.]
MKIYLNIFRVIGIFTIVQFLFGSMNIVIPLFQNDTYKGIFRPSLWFYEPSYLATYFSFYIGISLVRYTFNKRYKKDLLFSWFCTALTTSSTGFISIGISMFFLVLLQNSLYKKIKTFLLVLVSGVLLFIIVAIIKFDILKIFLGRLFTEGIKTSSGVRVLGMIEALEVFKKFFILGIGANSYENYHITGSPVTNVTLEILTNLGIIGFFCFGYFFYYLYSIYKNKYSVEIKMMWISFLLFLIVLQANQNYMRLYMWVHIGIFIGMSQKIKK